MFNREQSHLLDHCVIYSTKASLALDLAHKALALNGELNDRFNLVETVCD